VSTLPLIGVTTADAMQVRTGTLGTPLERVIVNILASHGVVTITLSLGAERTNHLRMAQEAAFADVDVAPDQTNWVVGLYTFNRRRSRLLEEQRNDFEQTAPNHGKQRQHNQQAYALFNLLMLKHCYLSLIRRDDQPEPAPAYPESCRPPWS